MSKNAIDQLEIDRYRLSGTRDHVLDEFQIHRHSDVHISFFPIRKETSFVEIRTSPKSRFESLEEIIVGSVLQEEFPKETNISIDLEQLEALHCSRSEIAVIFAQLLQTASSIPEIPDVISSELVTTGSDLNWLLVEDKDNYHSIFWRTEKSNTLKLCA